MSTTRRCAADEAHVLHGMTREECPGQPDAGTVRLPAIPGDAGCPDFVAPEPPLGLARRRALTSDGAMTCALAGAQGVCKRLDRPSQLLDIWPVSSVWVTPMKTTIELPDDLPERSKAVARPECSTLKALIEEGLRLARTCADAQAQACRALRPEALPG